MRCFSVIESERLLTAATSAICCGEGGGGHGEEAVVRSGDELRRRVRAALPRAARAVQAKGESPTSLAELVLTHENGESSLAYERSSPASGDAFQRLAHGVTVCC
jgi:hypothetical protein